MTGVAGEQFALQETVSKLRKLRDEGPGRELVVVSGADPLNLVGILTPHARVPSIAGNRIAYVDGIPLAILQGGDVSFTQDLSESLKATLYDVLKRGRIPKSITPSSNDAPQPSAPPSDTPAHAQS